MTTTAKWFNIFLASESEIKGLLVKKEADQVEVVAKTPFLSFEPIQDSFLTALDKILSRFYQINNLEVKESIFILSQDWLVANELTPKRKEILKLAKRELNLQVNGFVVLEEALNQFIRQKTLSPPSYLFLMVMGDNLGLSRVELGRVSEHFSIGRSQNLKDDLSEVISRLRNKVLPLKVIIASQNIEAVKKELNSVSWTNEFPFSQQPILEFYSFDQLLTNILQVIFKGHQINWAVQKPKLEMDKEKKEKISQPVINEIIEKEDNLKELNQEDNNPLGKNNLQELGVFFSEDELAEEEGEKKKKVYLPFLAKLKLKLPHLHLSLPRVHLNLHLEKLGHLSQLILLLLPLISLPLLLIGFFYFFFKAIIVITPRTEALNKKAVITFSTTAAKADYQKLILPARQIEVTLTKTATTVTSGNTLTGDPAKGQITIYNKTAKPHTFKKGIILYLAEDPSKKLKLDETVNVASQSSQTDANEVTTLVPGKAEAQAETLFWGDEANLSVGRQLYFLDYDKASYKAKVSQAFSGGKEYQVQSVSQDDIDKLKEKIKEEVDKDLDEILKSKLKSQEKIIKSSLKLTHLKDELSTSLNKPADKVSLTSQVKAQVLVYDQNDVLSIVNHLLQETIPQGFVADKNNLSWSFKPLNDNQYQLKLNIPLLWNFDKTIIKKNLVGRDLQSAVFYLQNLPGVFAFQITFQPPVPKFLQHLPYRKRNILINLKTS